MKKIAILGEGMIELSGELFGVMKQSYGGDTLNTATYLSRISLPKRLQTYYISVLGNDKLSQMMKAYWQADGIRTDWVLTDPHRQPSVYLIQLDEQGERSFLYWRNQSAARYLVQHPDFEQVMAQLAKTDMLYLSGISLAVLPPSDREVLLNHLRFLKNSGVELAFDTNYRPNLWQTPEDAQSYYTKMLALTDVALVTFEDEQNLWQDQDIEQSLHRLSQFDIATIVVKDGKNGAMYMRKDQPNRPIYRVPTQAVQHVVDTTSAGDSFNAGFLNGYLQGKPLEICCRQGNQIAAIVIQHSGAIIAPEATQSLRIAFNSTCL